MVRAQRWSYLQRPRPWREFHHFFGAGGGTGGAVSSSAGRASMARNRQVPRRSGSAIGVASEIKCKIWVDDVVFYADTENELLDTLDEILARLRRECGIVCGCSQVYLFLP